MQTHFKHLKITVLLLTIFANTQAQMPFSHVHDNYPNQLSVDNLSKAITFKTITYLDTSKVDFLEFTQFHQFLEETYPCTHEILVKNVIGKYSLLYKWPGKNNTQLPILFMGHSDVVPVDSITIDQWEYPPFDGVVDSTYIWGRGTIDDKLGIISMMEAVERLTCQGYIPERTIYFAFGHDEEIGGRMGALQVSNWLAERNIEFDFILDEGGAITQGVFEGIQDPIAIISIAEKGTMNIALEINNAHLGGHSSMPPKESAIEIMSKAIMKIDENPLPARLTLPTEQMLRSISPHLSGIEKFAINNLWLFRKTIINKLDKDRVTGSLIKTVMTPTIIHGGDKENVLPKYVRANINVRILQGDNVNSVLQHVKNVIDDDRISVKLHGPYINPSNTTDYRSDPYKLLSSTIQEIYPGVTVSPFLAMGSTDTRHFGERSDTILRFLPLWATPEDAKRGHGINERVSIENYLSSINFYSTLIQNTDKL